MNEPANTDRSTNVCCSRASSSPNDHDTAAPQRAVTGRRPVARRQQREAVVEPGGDLGDGHACAGGPRPARWPTGARRGGARSRRRTPARPRPARTPAPPPGPARRTAAPPARRRRRRGAAGPAHNCSPGTRSRSRLVATTRTSGHRREQLLGELGDRVEDVLAVVQHHHDVAVAQHRRRPARRARRPAGRRSRARRRRRRRAESLGRGRQLAHHDRAVRACGPQPMTDLDHQPGLADAARADQGDQAMGLDHGGDLVDERVATDQRRRRHRQPARRRPPAVAAPASRSACWAIRAGDGSMPELVAEQPPEVVERPQRLGRVGRSPPAPPSAARAAAPAAVRRRPARRARRRGRRCRRRRAGARPAPPRARSRSSSRRIDSARPSSTSASSG